MQNDVVSHLIEGKIEYTDNDRVSFKTLNDNLIKYAHI